MDKWNEFGFGVFIGAVFALLFMAMVAGLMERYEKRICQEWTQAECEKKWRPVEE